MTVRVRDVALATATQSFTIMVHETPTPVPELALWESHMLQYGRLHGGRFLDGTYDFAATYYDAQRVYQQIAEYTGDATWLQVAEVAGDLYRDTYVLPNGGGAAGWWNFTHGLTNDYLTTGDVVSRNAVVQLSLHAAYAADGTPPESTESANLSREVAYAITSYINAELVGEARRARLGLLFGQA